MLFGLEGWQRARRWVACAVKAQMSQHWSREVAADSEPQSSVNKQVQHPGHLPKEL